MNRDSWVWLLSEYRAGRCSPEELEEVEHGLRMNAEVRDLYVDLINLEVGLGQCAEAVWVERQATLIAGGTSRGPVARRAWAGIAAGIALGLMAGILLSASVVRAFTGTRGAARGEMLGLANGDFETPTAPLSEGVPRAAAVWGGDFAQTVDAEQGVIPSRGGRMLKFLRADNQLTPPESRPAVSEMWQVISLRSDRSTVAAPPRQIEIAARFNAADLASGERMTFGVSLHAFAGFVEEAPELWRHHKTQALASASQEELLDRRTSSWQTLRARMALPPEATILLVGLRASRKGADPVNQDFGAHYVDEVEVYFVEPSPEILPTP